MSEKNDRTVVNRVRYASVVTRFRPVGKSDAILLVRRLIELVAPVDSNVLILGESGTGKEMVARHIHELSSRAGGPFHQFELPLYRFQPARLQVQRTRRRRYT